MTGIALTSLVILARFFYLLYLKVGIERLSSRKIQPLTHSTLSLISQQTLNLVPRNAYQLKECSLATIRSFLKQHPKVDQVYIQSLLVPTALLHQLLQKEILLNEKELVSFYTLENAKGEKFQITGFEKALLMQRSVLFYNFWKGKNHQKMSLIQDSHESELLKILLQSLYDPKALEEKQEQTCLLAAASFKFQLNEEEINKRLEKLLITSFDQKDTHNIKILLDFFKHYQKPLKPSIQQSLQTWLNSSIKTSTFLSNIQILKHYSPDSLDFSHTSISDQELSYLSELSLSTLSLKKCSITDEGLENLKGFHQLKELHLSWCDQITGQGLSHLKGLTHLQILDLSESDQITDQDLNSLKNLTYLQELNLNGCDQITDQGLENLKDVSQLKKLHLGWCNQITNQGLEHLKGLIHLQMLDLRWCDQIIDQNLKHLKNFPKLQKLNLNGCNEITDQGIENLKDLSQLRELNLNRCNKITDQGLKHLKDLIQLEKLNLSECNKITDQGLKHLKDLSQLRKLNLSDCDQITNRGLEDLKDLIQLQKLNLRECYQITDQGLEHLKGLNQLQKLILSMCYQITDQGLEHLKGLNQLQKLILNKCHQITDQGLKNLKDVIPRNGNSELWISN